MPLKDQSEEKTILFLCKCSTHVSNYIEFETIIDWAKAQKSINVVAISNLLCAPRGKEFYKEILSDFSGGKIKSIVVAACSPKLHEKTFRTMAEELDINISKVNMANIREQCAWVTKDKGLATQKAIRLINAALKRSFLTEDLIQKKMQVESDICVIGGGVAGMMAARVLSQAGRKVFLIEKNISIGGAVIKSEEVAPNMACSPCLLAPILSDIRDDPNIQVIANAELTEVLGFFGNFTVRAKRKARFIKDNCIGCEECFPVCPVELENPFHENLGKKKAVYTLFPGSMPAQAAIEKEQCLHFIDNSCDKCVTACPFQSIDFSQEDEMLEIKAGALILATGFESYDVSGIAGLGQGDMENVYTTAQFERLASSNGPSGGKILLKSGAKPASIAVIHCAGSLREDHLPYCSNICCQNALKVGELTRKQIDGVKVLNIHKDLVHPGPEGNHFYKKQVAAGTEFIYSGDLKGIHLAKENGQIIVNGTDFEPIKADMVILSNGIIPALRSDEMAEMLNLDLNSEGFFQSAHSLLHATGSSLDGIYLAGCAAGPAGVSESVTRAQAVAGDALSKLVPGREIELEMMTSMIREELCAGCKLCIASCPYQAVSFDKEKRVSVINEAICRGCGTCVAGCPSGAALARHFTNEQIMAEIGGLINE